MKYIDEFRNPQLIKQSLAEIRKIINPDKTYRIMEVCGGHTHAIYRFGLHELLPANIRFLHGPGCPVCVLPMGRIDEGLSLTETPDVIFTAFGDMMRVPGAKGSPLAYKARGADIRVVYSPLDALSLAQKNPDKHIVFFAIGFETTAPSTALTLKRAKALGVDNFSIYCNHVLVVPAMQAVLDNPISEIDAFIGPGHVTTVIGANAYADLAKAYQKPVVVSGFEPLDLLQSVLMILKQLDAGNAQVENQYGRAVSWDGNLAAQKVMAEVFELRSAFEWRGLSSIANSAFGIHDAFAQWDTEARFNITRAAATEHKDAACGAILVGAKQANDCPLFATVCNPEHPIGAPMVSSEGACAAYFNYVHSKRVAGKQAVSL